MKRLLAAVVLVLTVVSPVTAVEVDPNLTGTVTVTDRTATTVTVRAEQTGGEPVRLRLEHYCYQGDVYGGSEEVAFKGSITVTLSTASRRYKGATVTPNRCEAFLIRYLPSATLMILDIEPTFP